MQVSQQKHSILYFYICQDISKHILKSLTNEITINEKIIKLYKHFMNVPKKVYLCIMFQNKNRKWNFEYKVFFGMKTLVYFMHLTKSLYFEEQKSLVVLV